MWLSWTRDTAREGVLGFASVTWEPAVKAGGRKACERHVVTPDCGRYGSRGDERGNNAAKRIQLTINAASPDPSESPST